MKQRRKRIWKGAVLALAVAGIAAPAAQGRPFLTSWGKVVTPGTTSNQSDSPQALRALTLRSEAMNQRYQQIGGGYALEIRSETMNKLDQRVATRPDDRTGVRGPGAVDVQRPQLVTVSSGRFDWKDAGVGAGAVFGTSIVLIGALMASRRRQAHVAV